MHKILNLKDIELRPPDLLSLCYISLIFTSKYSNILFFLCVALYIPPYMQRAPSMVKWLTNSVTNLNLPDLTQEARLLKPNI